MTPKLAIPKLPTSPVKTFQTPVKLALCSPLRGNHYPDFSVNSNSKFLWAMKAGNMPPPRIRTAFLSLPADRHGHVVGPMRRKQK